MIAQPQILDNLKFFAGADIARSGGATAGTTASPGILAQGEIVITDPSNVILDVATVLTAPAIKIVMGRGTDVPMWESQLFTYVDIKNYKGLPYAAKVQQVTYVGYNAVANTGSFDVINDNYYTLVVSFYELLSQEASSLMNPIVVEYLSDASATEEEIVSNLYKQLCNQLKYWSRKPILAEMVSNAAGAATNDAAAILTLGSTLVTTAPNVAAASAVGDYIRIGSQSTDTDEVYKIAAISGSTLTLDTPFQGATGSYLIHRVTSANIVAGDLGIRLTGVNQPFILDSRPLSLVTFQVGITNGGSTPVATTTGANIGYGTYEQMRTIEAASWRNQGQLYTYTEFPPTTVETDLTSTQHYSTLNVVLEKPIKALNIGEARAQLCIGCALDGNVANTFDSNFIGATGVVSVLDSYVTNFTSLAGQAGNL